MKVRFITNLDKFKNKIYLDEVPDYLSTGDLIKINDVQLEINTKYFDINERVTVLELRIPKKYFIPMELGGGLMDSYKEIYY